MKRNLLIIIFSIIVLTSCKELSSNKGTIDNVIESVKKESSKKSAQKVLVQKDTFGKAEVNSTEEINQDCIFDQATQNR